MSLRHVLHARRGALLLTLAAFVGVAFGCQEPASVGNSCAHDRDCLEQCVGGKKFPDGTCTVSCSNDYDCPAYAACVHEEGGICLPLCDIDADCRDKYSCKDVDREGAGGKAPVCIH